MKSIMESTAIIVEPIKAYGWIHISYFIIGVILSVFIAYKMRNVNRKKLNLFIFIIGLILIVTEVYKQLFYTYYIGAGTYQWWIFPFQLCSIPMYFCLIMPFVKNEKIYHAMAIFLVSYNLLGGFISFLEPSGLIHEYLFLTIHAFLWHMLLVLLGFVIGFNKSIIKKLKDYKYTFIMFIILALIAFLINLTFWDYANGDINMFFIGPKVSPLVVFNFISTKYGWFINDIIYILGLSAASFAMYLPFTTKKLTKL